MPEFNRDALRRVSRNVRKEELSPTPKKVPGATPANINWFGKLAITTSTITAAGTGTLGKGTAKLQLIKRDISNNATYANSSYDDVTVYNMASSIASGKLIQVKVVDGIFLVDTVAC